MKPYPHFYGYNMREIMRRIIALRHEDIIAFDQLKQRMGQWRNIRRIPSTSQDIASQDQVGDMSWDHSYLYLLCQEGEQLVWKRMALTTWE